MSGVVLIFLQDGGRVRAAYASIIPDKYRYL